MSLHVRPITIKAAWKLVAQWHRHLKKRSKNLWATSVVDEAGAIRGVAIVALPVARLSNDGWTCEVVRCATDGHRNACSLLYSTCRRAAQTLGYRRCLTKTLTTESGSSLRAIGCEPIGVTKARARGWDRSKRKRDAPEQPQMKFCWDLMAVPPRTKTGLGT
jgi:hypothetical protein